MKDEIEIDGVLYVKKDTEESKLVIRLSNISTIHSLLGSGFAWKLSKKGFKYWKTVSDNLNDMRIKGKLNW